MNLRHLLTQVVCGAAALAGPNAYAASNNDESESRYLIPVTMKTDSAPFGMAQRRTNKATGDMLTVVGVVILVAGLGSGNSGASQVLTLGAGGFLIGLGFDQLPTDPWHRGYSVGYWRGKPTVSVTLLRF